MFILFLLSVTLQGLYPCVTHTDPTSLPGDTDSAFRSLITWVKRAHWKVLRSVSLRKCCQSTVSKNIKRRELPTPLTPSPTD